MNLEPILKRSFRKILRPLALRERMRLEWVRRPFRMVRLRSPRAAIAPRAAVDGTFLSRDRFLSKRFITPLVFLIVVSGCTKAKKLPTAMESIKASTEKDKRNITVMIHGTLPLPNGTALTKPLYKALSRYLGTPLGFKHIDDLGDHAFAELGRTLSTVDRENFPLQHFYFFGWSGGLGHKARKAAAYDLYHVLNDLCRDPDTKLTLITHSHAGNIALYLDEEAREKNITSLSIERLILLACPVQDITEHYTRSPLFKRIYHIYSPGDVVQIMDPQGMQCKRHERPQTFFSRRIFSPHDRLVQAEIHNKTRSPGHLDFIKPDFMKALPSILHLLDDDSVRKKLPLSPRGTYRINLT
jgi:hypothetical protein